MRLLRNTDLSVTNHTMMILIHQVYSTMFHTRYLSNHGHVVQEECSHHDSNVDDGEGFADHVTIHGIGE